LLVEDWKRHWRAASAEHTPAPVTSQQLTILLVEDDTPTREMYRTALRMAGFELRLASTGLAALQQIDQELPDAIVLDLDLPYVSGIEIHDELLADRRTACIPVVVVTGTDWRPHRRPAAILTKPISPERLADVIHRVTARPARRETTAQTATRHRVRAELPRGRGSR
jgi:DNA-binding response OmpR family regulator